MANDRAPVRVSAEFTVDDLSRARIFVQDAARAAGVDPARVNDLITAVNELVCNAVLYAGGTGRVTAEQSVTGFSVEVSDRGPGLPAGAVRDDRPDPRHVGGRGLWMVRCLFPDASLSSTAAGLTVRMSASTPQVRPPI